jgi:hypothetical protein
LPACFPRTAKQWRLAPISQKNIEVPDGLEKTDKFKVLQMDTPGEG